MAQNKKFRSLQELYLEDQLNRTSGVSTRSDRNEFRSLEELYNEEHGIVEDEIAPISTSPRVHGGKSGSLDDYGGTWFKDAEGGFWKKVGGTIGDLFEEASKGIAEIPEKLLDAMATHGTQLNQDAMMEGAQAEIFRNRLTGNTAESAEEVIERHEKLQEDSEKATAEFVAKDILKTDNIDFVDDKYSKFGQKSESLIQSGGQLGAQIGVSLIPGIGQTLGTALMAGTTYGAEAENAYRNGATFDEGAFSAANAAMAEVITERLGGISFGGKTVTDAIFGKLSSKMTGKLANALIATGKVTADALAEGGEEILAGYITAIGQQMTYMDDKELEEIFSDEDKLDSFIGGAVLGGLGGTVEAVARGKGYVTGLSKGEQKVIDKVYEDAIAEREKDGKKLTSEEKNEIYNNLIEQMDTGQLDIDDIESILGGEEYKAYTEAVENEEKLKTELDELRSMKPNDMNDFQTTRMNELKGMNLNDTTNRDSLRQKLDEKMAKVVGNDSRLAETYRERARRREEFTADLSRLDDKRRATYERAMQSGILNNTYKAHKLVETASHLEAKKGVIIDFANNAKIKEMGYAVEGKTVDGFVNTKDNHIYINIQSHKAWQSTVGHEIGHILESTGQAYTELRNSLYAYAESKGELESRRTELTELYKDMDADVEAELTADLLGEYLFNDTKFINNLTQNRNLFQRIYDEVKYLCKVATGKQLTEIEKVKHEFDKAWKQLSITEENLDNEAQDTEVDDVQHSISVTDKQTLNDLNEQIARGEYNAETNPDGGYYVTYKSMSFWGYDDEGNAILRSPMAEYVDGELSNAYLIPKDKSKLNWYQATETIDENTGLPSGLMVKVKKEGNKSDTYLPASENQDLIADDWSNLFFELQKKVYKNGKWENSPVKARYNPYEHSSNLMLNDQFKAAHLRDNLVTVKMYVPISEDNGTYRAQYSKDATGWADWKTGTVAGKINKQKDLQRRVYLSRYAAPVEIVPDSEVAQAYKEYLDGTDVAVPDNVVSPNLLKELRNAGVPIKESGKVKHSISKDSNGNDLGVAVQKRFANSKAVDENGNLKVLYHGTASGEFYTFDKSKGNVEGDFGSGFYFTDSQSDVNNNYYDGGADFDIRVEKRAMQIQWEEEISYDEALEKAREELYKGGFKHSVYLNIENPAVVGETILLDPDKYFGEYNRDDYDSEEDYDYDVEMRIADDINQIIWDVERNVDVYNTDGLSEILWNAVNEGGIGVEQLKANIDKLYLEDSNGNYVGNEVARQIIESLGYDGIIDNTVSTKFNMGLDKGTTHYIVFKPNQIKSIDNQNPTDNPDIRYSLSKDIEGNKSNGNDIYYAPTFYSHMGKVIDDVKTAKMGANSVVSYLKGKGVKNEEIKWSGIEAFLEGKKSVTKEELQEFVAGSQLQIEEVVRDSKTDNRTTIKKVNRKTREVYFDGQLVDTLHKNEHKYWDSEKYQGQFFMDDDDIINTFNNRYGLNTRWSEYKLDGGKNYKEIVFRLPNSTYSNGAMATHWGHWRDDTKGIFAHARTQDFDTADGKMLFIEEIQSDWHNEGHKEGYSDSKRIGELATIRNKLEEALHDFDDPNHMQRAAQLRNDYHNLQEELKSEGISEKSVPDAPFKDTYHEYVLKSLIRQAAENGYDSIGWTTADIQSERWSDEFAEGYRIEYDQDIPKFLNKYGKKWGAKVGSTKLKNGNEVWSMDITDSMKESVLYEGQALYSISELDAPPSTKGTPLSELALEQDIAPVQGEDINVPANEEAVDDAPNLENIAPLPDEQLEQGEYEAIRPKPEKQPSMKKVNQNATEPKVAEVLTESPKIEKKKDNIISKLFTNLVDKGAAVENLSLETKNPALQHKYAAIRRSESKAQYFMKNGKDGVKSLDSIISEVEKAGLAEDLYKYVYHKHNVDRMSRESREAPNLKRLEGEMRKLKLLNLQENQLRAIASEKITKETDPKRVNLLKTVRKYLASKDIKNKPVFGYSITADMSQAIVDKYEASNPQLMKHAQDIYNYMNYLRKMMVDGGLISQKTADLWAKEYPYYVPIRRVGDEGLMVTVPLDSRKTGVNAPVKRAKGGNRDINPLFKTMADRTLQTFKAIEKNKFGIELKNTLGSTIENTTTNLDETIDNVVAQDGLLQEGKNGKNPTFTVFEDGKRVTFEITEELFDAMKPTSKAMSYTNRVLNTASNLHRGVLTEYNPLFAAKNAIKDAQDVLINSQHPAKTYANFPKAVKELTTKGKWYTEYMENGGEMNTYFDKQSNEFTKEERTWQKVVGFPLHKISQLNNFIEKVPRLAEYIASRENGSSIDGAMLDAARVTTDFSAGGDLTKLANRNGATFLNASVQGFAQNVRNIREAKMKGLKGWLGLAAKVTLAGLPAMLLNNLLWDDDEEYEELSDYVKDNYYVVGKLGNGKFVRIPKGRASAVIQEAFEQVGNALTGDDEVDFGNFYEMVMNNLAPNNPLDNNIIAPIGQVLGNKTWYGEDLVPTRLQNLPAAEQYDESTDSISKWLGETLADTPLEVSPYKINYLLDQYGGVVSDIALPMFTPEAESGDNSFVGNLIAPVKDMFTTDGVMNNQNVSDFYDTVDELTVSGNSSYATDEDILKSKYMNSVNGEISELYKEQRAIQNSTLSDSTKYRRVKEIQKQINSLMRGSLNSYGKVSINGNYATVGDRHYKMDDEGVWQKISDEQLEKQNDVTSTLGISPDDYWADKEEYDYAYKNPEKYAVSKVVGGYDSYRAYSKELSNLHADKDENGNSISGSRKAKVLDYINNLDIDYEQKIILYRSQYDGDDTYNVEIIDYINNRDDLTYEDRVAIFTELGFTVKDGKIYW